ncbi:hypothetical protein RUM43_000439 [Polyplax serrata]|uniref:Uncharacterized protein n=1 Tax=Polyplax serrata TaxID=468196 RepID=A0AAN8XSA1_POLSC
MSREKYSFDEYLEAFKNVCISLENDADIELKQITEECAEEFNASTKILQSFNQLMSGVSETYSELLNTNEILKCATNRAIEQNVFSMPYELQGPFVKCIRELYGGKFVGNGICDNKLIDNKNIELLMEIIKTSEKNLAEIRQVEVALQQTKDHVPTD